MVHADERNSTAIVEEAREKQAKKIYDKGNIPSVLSAYTFRSQKNEEGDGATCVIRAVNSLSFVTQRVKGLTLRGLASENPSGDASLLANF